MATLFQNVLTASVHGSIVIGAVLLLRLVLKKTPKKFLCFLWLLAGIRLLMPFEIRTDLSLQPEVPRIPYVSEAQEELSQPEILPQLHDAPVLPVSPAGFAETESVPQRYYPEVPGMDAPVELAGPVDITEPVDWMKMLSLAWFAVACGFGVYMLFAYVALKVQVRDAIQIPGGWESDRIETAFILGFLRPKIYIPMGISASAREYILAHERTHLEKGDHWFKMIGFLALAIHWFNPLVWAAYILLCKDIEMACDEQVVRFMDLEERKRYSAALLACSSKQVHFAACPVAFGEVSVKERIKSVLNYKKPGFWISLLGVIAIVFVAVCLVTSPAEEAPAMETTEATEPVNRVTVTDPDAFLAAIASNTEITLEPGTYILSEASGYGRSGSDFYFWEDIYEGYQLVLTGVENLTIRGSGSLVTVVETDPRMAEVLVLEDCEGIVLEDFTAGHTRNRGQCVGGVVELKRCRDIAINRMGLYGCGVIGLNAIDSSGIVLSESDIYECSSGAVYLMNSHGVTVSGNRVYEIGSQEFGGYTFFDIDGCTDVRIANNSFSDSTLYNLVATHSSDVELANNLFANNRPQSGVFGGDEVSITMYGNRFEDNSIRNWYLHTVTAKDEKGELLTEEALNALYGIVPEAAVPQAPQLEIHVSTVDEFLAAIGPDTDIVLEGALYDLSTATGYGTSSGEYYYWEDIFDGPGLIIQNVNNMTIRTATADVSKHTIAAIPRYADVLNFRACSNITLSGFTAGHTKEQGSCAGGVLEFTDCDSMTVDTCGLFGCGILGVQADYCSNITVKNTEIYECSQGGIQIWNVDGVTIENVTFRDIGGRNTIYLNSSKNVTIDGRQVIRNESGGYEASTPEQEETWTLNAVLNDFADAYLNNAASEIAWHLAADCALEPYVVKAQQNAWPHALYFEVNYNHVETLRREGSLVVEVPFREVTDEEDVQYLLVTVVEENGTFKIRDCRVK